LLRVSAELTEDPNFLVLALIEYRVALGEILGLPRLDRVPWVRGRPPQRHSVDVSLPDIGYLL
jgi:hypothetical protein